MGDSQQLQKNSYEQYCWLFRYPFQVSLSYSHESKTDKVRYTRDSDLRKIKKLGTTLDEGAEINSRKQIASLAIFKYRRIWIKIYNVTPQNQNPKYVCEVNIPVQLLYLDINQNDCKLYELISQNATETMLEYALP